MGKKSKKHDGYGDDKDDDGSVISETGLQHNEEVLKKIYELEAEKRIGQQTVTEAINAVSELKWQQVKERTDRSKLELMSVIWHVLVNVTWRFRQYEMLPVM